MDAPLGLGFFGSSVHALSIFPRGAGPHPLDQRSPHFCRLHSILNG
jgi:hypothetical protein